MDKPTSSLDDILNAMPRVQEAVRKEIAARISAGEDIRHAVDGKIMMNDRIGKPVKPEAGESPKRAQRRAA